MHTYIKNICRKQILFPALIFMVLILFWISIPATLFNEPYSTVIHDRNGELLGASIAQDEQWRFPPPAIVPEKFLKAAVYFEDRRFFYHPGVDIIAIARAAKQNIIGGRIISGASTITMQVIRLSRKGKPRTFGEKFIEMILALRLELSTTKNEIMTLYAAHAPFGGNVIGLEAASWRYFNRAPDKLSWAESAMLAVLPNNPALIHPGRNRDRLKQKRDNLLARLLAYNIIDKLTYDLAIQEPLPPEPYPIPMHAPHLLSRIQQLKYKKHFNQTASTDIHYTTTLDKNIQIQATNIVARHHAHLSRNGIHNAAALIIETNTGNVLAYIGNILDLSNASHGNHVDIITSPRSTGSILKPILYAGMLNAGELLPSELVPDVPTRMGGFAPQNYSKTFYGAIPASMALARSLNVPAVRMLNAYGTDRFYTLLKNMGMTTLFRPANDYGLTLILGGAECTLWDITGIYAGFGRCVNDYANANIRKNTVFFSPAFLPNSIRSLPNHSGPQISAAACWLTLEAMLEVERPNEENAWRSFSSAKKIAWKTGTSYGFRDGWAVGITPQYTIGVWVGNADGEGRPGLTGISTAAPILFDLFSLLDVQGWFKCPEADIIDIEVCAKSGYRKGPNCAETKTIQITQNSLKSKCCPYCKLIHCDSTFKWRVHSDCERISAIETVKWFVLPPAMEWYYKKSHSDYHPLPAYRKDCLDALDGITTSSLSLIYPGKNAQLYVPIELDGKRGKTVFEATHRNAHATIFWHLDNQFIGSTKDLHQMAISPGNGNHNITLVDENGEYLSRSFTILSK